MVVSSVSRSNRRGPVAYLLAICLAFVLTTAAQAKRLVTFEDLDGVSSGQAVILATLDLSHDGKSLAVERGGQLLVVDVRSRRIVQRLGEGLLPRWSPDDRKLAFYSRHSGVLQLWIWQRTESAPQQLTDLPRGIDPDVATRIMGYISDAFHFSWSPDSMRIAFCSRVSFPVPLARAPGAPLVLNSTTPPDLTLLDVFAHPGGGTGGTIESRNGRDIAYRPANPREALYSQVFVAELATHHTVQLTHDRAEAFDAVWSPTAQTIAFARIDSGMAGAGAILSATAGEILSLDAATAKQRVLAQGNGVKYRPLWSPDGSRISFLVSDSFESAASIRVVQVGDGKTLDTYPLGGPVVAYDRDRTSKGDDYLVSYVSDEAKSGNTIAHVHDASFLASLSSGTPEVWSQASDGSIAWTTGESLRDVWLAGPERQSAKRLLDLAPTDEFNLGKELKVTWRNGRGETLNAALLLPPDYQPGKRYPLIVDVYPFGTSGWMNPMSGNQAWAAAGYAVFKPGPRAPHAAPNCSGSPSFCAAGQGPSGWDVTVDDVMGGIAELDRRGLIDSKRMCLFGHSSGGGVVDYLVTRTDAFKCAVSVAPVLPNWLGTSFLWYDSLGLMAHLAGGTPWQDPSAYVKLSAVLRADKVKTPMLLADGDEDGAFLLGTVEMYNALRATGADVTLLRYPHQGHLLIGDALRDFWGREMDFFRAHLKSQ